MNMALWIGVLIAVLGGGIVAFLASRDEFRK